MKNDVIFVLAMLALSLLLDGAIRPRVGGLRHWKGMLLHLLVTLGVFGLALLGSGNVMVAAILGTAFVALFMIASNAKYAMLGEPLVFSDLALIAAIFRHPRFYFTAISLGERLLLTTGGVAAIFVLILLFTPDLWLHLAGLGLMLFAAAGAALLLRAGLANTATTPQLERDLARFGLMATLLLYWMHWRKTADPAPWPADQGNGQPDVAGSHLILIVQCESFCDPVEITGDDRDALPGLAHARSVALQWGELEVSGFGAYTMRTEYGVLFGRSEAALGFRRYDPFLTAHGEASHALAARLRAANYRCTFIHPHDMRFYGRDRLMPAIGFDRMIGDSAFAPIADGGGRYIDDQTLGAALCDLIDQRDGKALIYAVTMENHGPWEADDTTSATGRLDAYLCHLRNSDAMLSALVDRLSSDHRPATLVFFGDHRPSIPGVTAPHGARHTPYVMLRFDGDGPPRPGHNRRIDLTPDQLHHEILRAVAVGRDTAAPIAEEK